MKKFYTFALAVLASASMFVGAQSLSDTQTLWAKTFTNSNTVGTSPTSAGYGMAVSSDGAVFTLGNSGSRSTDDVIKFGDQEIGTGTAYGGNSNNLDLVIAKVSADGTLQWVIKSTSGEVDNTNGPCIKATPDGGAIAYVNLRHSEGYSDNGVVIKDAKNVEHTFDITLNGGNRHYEPVVMKIDADGGIEWTKQIKVNALVDHTVYPKFSKSPENIGQGIYAYALCVDNAGNIFIGGRMLAAITIDNVTIEPHNVDTWDGDAQNSVGNIYIIKLDSEGNYVKHLVSDGKATQENARDFVVVGNKIYMFAMYAGVADETFSLGGIEATANNAYIGLAAAELDTDLNVQWFKTYPSTMSGSTLQMPTMCVIGDHIYLMGTAKMGMTIGEQTYATVNTRDPWLLQIDAASGEALKCLVYKDGQHGFFGAFEGTDGYLYAVERGLGSMNAMANWGNVHMGTAIHKIDQSVLTTTPGDGVVLIDRTVDGYGVMPIGTNLFVYDRQPNQNKVATYINSDITFTSSAFIGRVSAFRLPVGAVESLTLDVDGEVQLNKGATLQLTATLLPQNVVNSNIIWSSTDESVVTVDENGLITAVADAEAAQSRIRKAATNGNTAVITATSASNPNVKASVLVSVDNATAITTIEADARVASNNVYTIDGRMVKKGSSSVDGLPAGLYIAGGKKVVVK